MEHKTIKILAIDDKLDNLISIGALIKEEFPNSKLLSSLTGEKGLELASTEDPDVILLDIIMPGMDGYEVCRRLKADNLLCDIPVVFVTALSDDKQSRILALKAGGEAFLYKPIDETELKAQIQAMVKIRDARKEKLEEKMLLAVMVEETTKELRETHTATLNLLEDLKNENAARRKIEEELEYRVMERTQQLKTAIQEIESFSYSVSHDLQAPLRAIDGFSKIILEDFIGDLPEEAQNYFMKITESTHHMFMLIHDLLNLAKVSQSNMTRGKVDLSALLVDLDSEFRQQFPERKVEMVIPPKLEVVADPGFLRIALENLMNNAWKFTSKAEQALVEFGKMTENGKVFYFLRDNGAGFNMSYKDKLFVAFQRFHSSSDYPGTGIGLATVHRIILQHGGEIWADSKVGEGATFYFTLGG